MLKLKLRSIALEHFKWSQVAHTIQLVILCSLANSFKHSNPVTADLQIQSNISQVPLGMMQEWPYLIVIVTSSVHMSACVLRSTCHLHSMHVAGLNF